MKHPYSLTDDQLRSYADEHIRYEFEMLIWTAGTLYALMPVKDTSPVSWAVNNAFMNSFATHARNLIDFLYSRYSDKDQPTDIILQDYIDESVAEQHLLPITPLLEEAKTKANKQVAHLTLNRIEYEVAGKGWYFVQIPLDIAKAFHSIASVLPDTKTSQAFRQLISQPGLLVPTINTAPIKSDEGQLIGLEVRLASGQ